LSLPPLDALQRLDRALFDLWSRLGAGTPPADMMLIELAEPGAQAAIIETARWQRARLLVTTLPDAPVVPAGKLPLIGPVAVASADMPILRETGWAEGGYLWSRPDLDGVIRYEFPRLGDLAATASLPLAAALRLSQPAGDGLKRGGDLARAPAENVDRFGRRWLRFYAPEDLKPMTPDSIRLQPDALTDKIVVIGLAGAPRHATPVGSLSTVELVAQTLTGYRQGQAVATNLWLDAAGWAAAAIWILVAAVLPVSGFTALAMSLAGAGSLAGLGAAGFLNAGVWIPVAGPGLLVTALAALAFVRQPTRPVSQVADGSPQTLLDGRRLIARGDLAGAWEVLRQLPMSSELLSETYELGCMLAEHGEQQLAADAFHRVAQADAGYRDVARRLVASCEDTRASTPERPKPSSLGRYEVLGVIGSGAMGVVYLGRDPSINRIVAIKAFFLEQEFEPSYLEEARERFAREAEIAGRLSHPSIVTIYDIGEQDGIAYIAMEFVRGTHLSAHAAPETLLPVGVVLNIAARAAEALDYAHRQNVVHRDIKPANIMYDSATDSLKITDFGVARLMDVSRTRTGVILGTPSYMSPEQLQGENVNGHTDLFALGVSLYQLLTGHLPFRGTSMTELMFVIANEPHIPVTEIRTELPAVLDSIVGRALAKNPASRYNDGAAMAQALRAALSGQ
jgi:serine/threonine-protein kinase